MSIGACLFDLDGVITETAGLHAKAWKQTFDPFLRAREGGRFVPFDARRDYDRYVDGKPRRDGTRSFLAARGLSLPEGQEDDAPGLETILGLSQRKDETFLRLLRAGGARAYPGSVRYLAAVRGARLKTAVVSSSRHCREVVEAVALTRFFDARIDGHTLQTEHLRGKPAPDAYLAAARALDVPPARAAVFEDALAGVEAGRAGGFGFVVGVDRAGQAAELHEHGATVVVEDLAVLL
ncbi:MAG: beta-phosphoglucomutase family hydrolase [Myxococcales bacterium]